jgi:hypothetical protein
LRYKAHNGRKNLEDKGIWSSLLSCVKEQELFEDPTVKRFFYEIEFFELLKIVIEVKHFSMGRRHEEKHFSMESRHEEKHFSMGRRHEEKHFSMGRRHEEKHFSRGRRHEVYQSFHSIISLK